MILYILLFQFNSIIFLLLSCFVCYFYIIVLTKIFVYQKQSKVTSAKDLIETMYVGHYH